MWLRDARDVSGKVDDKHSSDVCARRCRGLKLGDM